MVKVEEKMKLEKYVCIIQSGNKKEELRKSYGLPFTYIYSFIKEH